MYSGKFTKTFKGLRLTEKSEFSLTLNTWAGLQNLNVIYLLFHKKGKYSNSEENLVSPLQTWLPRIQGVFVFLGSTNQMYLENILNEFGFG